MALTKTEIKDRLDTHIMELLDPWEYSLDDTIKKLMGLSVDIYKEIHGEADDNTARIGRDVREGTSGSTEARDHTPG